MIPSWTSLPSRQIARSEPRLNGCSRQTCRKLHGLPPKRSIQTLAWTRRPQIRRSFPEEIEAIKAELPVRNFLFKGEARRQYSRPGPHDPDSFFHRYKANIIVGGIIGLCSAGTAGSLYANYLHVAEGNSGPIRFIKQNFICSLENIRAGRWWVTLTSSLTHFSPLHLLVNMSALWSLGRTFIFQFGTPAFVGCWLISAVTGALGSLYWERSQGMNTAGPTMGGSVGASTALFGLMFAEFCFQPGAWVSFPIISFWRPAWQYGLFMAGGSIYCLLSNSLPRIGHAGHLGGMAGGVASYYVLLRPLIRMGP